MYLALAALVGIAVGGAVIEDAGSSWATLYLRDALAAPAALAALGYVAVVGFQFAGRILGDRLADRFGQPAVARAGGLIAAAGMGVALGFPASRSRWPGSRRRDSGRPPWCPRRCMPPTNYPACAPAPG